MDKPTLVSAITKLGVAGQQAGFTLEQMIDLLNAGITPDTLLELIAWRMEQPGPLTAIMSASHWVV